jgi:hypothetical protein
MVVLKTAVSHIRSIDFNDTIIVEQGTGGVDGN